MNRIERKVYFANSLESGGLFKKYCKGQGVLGTFALLPPPSRDQNRRGERKRRRRWPDSRPHLGPGRREEAGRRERAEAASGARCGGAAKLGREAWGGERGCGGSGVLLGPFYRRPRRWRWGCGGGDPAGGAERL